METNESEWGTGRMSALKIVCIRVLGLYIIVLIVMMDKMRFKVAELFSEGDTVPEVPLFLRSD